MFKTSIKCLIFQLCSIIGCILCMLAYTPKVQATQTIQAVALQSQDTPTATTTATNATITIMQSGTNSDMAVGHPGTKVQIVGNGFQAGNSINIYTTPDTTKCLASNTYSLQAFNPRTVTAKGDGTFQINAKWPASSGQQGIPYYICAIDTAMGTATISSTSFTVAQDVTITTTTPNVNPGDTATIMGSNWLPAQQLAVSISGNQGASSIISGQTTSDANGNFNINLTVPQGAPAGSYGVSVVAVNEQSLNTYKDQVITINATGSQATPTTTQTPATTPESAATPASTPTTVTTTGGNGTSNNTGTGGGGASSAGTQDMTLLIFTLGGLGLLLVIVGLIMYVSYSKTS